jgi:hypothetical protein
MASIERTAYPRFKPSLTADELQTLLQVPIIRLPGTTPYNLRLDSVKEWYHIRQKKRCYWNRFSRHTDILISTSEIKVHNCAFATLIGRPGEEIFAQNLQF